MRVVVVPLLKRAQASVVVDAGNESRHSATVFLSTDTKRSAPTSVAARRRLLGPK